MNLYLRNRFYIIYGVCIACFVLAFSYPGFMKLAWCVIVLFLILAVFEFATLWYLSKSIKASRKVNKKLSLGDPQVITYNVVNNANIKLHFELTDELPFQFQHRGYTNTGKVNSNQSLEIPFKIRPTERGEYRFGQLHMYISLPWLGFVQRKITHSIQEDIAVFPSFIQMKKYELQVFSQTATLAGIRRVREIGENDEFEHIRNYAQGDNIKSINWRATSRRNQLMINQFENSKSQMVYCVVDKGRSMKMPFENLTLLDYAINTSLVLSNIILRKYDKAGLVTFSDKIGAVLRADSQQHQLQKISKQLYDQKTAFNESNFELLYYTLQSQISRRSILLIFTNFEVPYEMQRNLKYLRSLNQKHLLVLVMFINTELESAQFKQTRKMKDIYYKTFAQKAIMDKEKIADELRANGIQVILTKPQDLSINIVNKYLEIKAKRMR
ncbi:MAG: DUF58 domain-containing protein [Saprospiraceae bacterium]|nr:DUF58 domain-containing protein [Saprospiraceae bacterium]